MASANLDLVKSIYAAWEKGDYSAFDWAHPDLEFVIADGPSPGSWTGVPGLVEGFRGVANAWEGLRGEADEYLELDEERVLVLTSWSGRGKTSGLELRQMRTKGANLFHIHGGLVTRLVAYWAHERALADLNVAPGTGSSRT